MAIELAGPSARSLAGAVVHFVFSIGQILLGVTAIYVHNFRTILQILFGPTFFVITYVWLVPESVRWLMHTGKMEQAKEILLKAAKINDVQLSDGAMAHLNETKKECDNENTKSPLRDALKSRIIFVRLITFCFCWFSINFVYYGLNVHSVAIGGSKYVNFTILNLAEIPAVIMTYVLMTRMGRKTLLIGSVLFCSVACVVSEIIPDDYLHFRLSMLVLGKFGVTIAFTILYMFTSEIFPTGIRQSCLNVCQTLGRCGSILAPQTPLLVHILPELPIISFGGIGVLTGFLVLTLPETRNTPLPDTIDEAEQIGNYVESKL